MYVVSVYGLTMIFFFFFFLLGLGIRDRALGLDLSILLVRCTNLREMKVFKCPTAPRGGTDMFLSGLL